MSTVTDRIEKLIALAGASNETEARTAACQACKLIRENKLVVVDPSEAPARGGSSPFGGMPDFVRNSAVPPGSPVAAEWRRQSGFQWEEPAYERRNAPPMEDGCVLLAKSKYNGTCRVCDKPYLVGEPIWWRKEGGGCSHQACGTEF